MRRWAFIFPFLVEFSYDCGLKYFLNKEPRSVIRYDLRCQMLRGIFCTCAAFYTDARLRLLVVVKTCSHHRFLFLHPFLLSSEEGARKRGSEQTRLKNWEVSQTWNENWSLAWLNADKPQLLDRILWTYESQAWGLNEEMIIWRHELLEHTIYLAT